MYYRKSNKYNATKTVVDGIEFSSRKESRRYKELKIMLEAGEISDLQMQVPYELIPAIKEPDTIGVRGGRKPGKTIERALTYICDFQYRDTDGNLVVEDVKGCRKSDMAAYRIFVIKRKMMLWKFGITVKEI